MEHTFRERLRYKFEQFLGKGGSGMFVSLTVVFLVAFVLIIGIRLLLVYFFHDSIDPVTQVNRSWLDDVYTIWLQMTDPGNMNQDIYSGPVSKIPAIIAGIAGMILLSALIAFITTQLEATLHEFRKGRGPVLEEGHTLILGWNERVLNILEELFIANESEDRASVVIISNESKEDMDGYLDRLEVPKNTMIFTANGNPSSIVELQRVSAPLAKSVIVLAGCSDSASKEDKVLSDIQAIKTVMAIVACQDGENQLPIICEIFNKEKNDIINFFEDPNIIALDNWEIMGKLLVQTSLTSGLEMVYNEILSFDLSEVYYYQAEWNGVKFSELPFHFKDGIPLGVYKDDGTVQLRPDEAYVMENDDQILILAEDDSTIHFNKSQLFHPEEMDYIYQSLDQKKKRILILGWHHVGSIYVSESNEYLAKGSEFDIVMPAFSDEFKSEIDELDKENDNINITLVKNNVMTIESLRSIDPFSYDNILILSQSPEEQNSEKIDSETLMILLILRSISKERADKSSDGTKIITQILNSDNQDLIIQADVDDFIISNKLITMILAQLSEQPDLKKFYDNIFQADGSEIYVKPATLYFKEFPIQKTFATVMSQAAKRNEICLGVRFGSQCKDSQNNFGVALNLAKDKKFELTDSDFLVVLSEDEL